MLREILPWGTGCGVAVRGDDLVAVAVKLGPKGVAVAGRYRIPSYRSREPASWGAEFRGFLRQCGLSRAPTVLCIPRRDVIWRTVDLPPMPRADRNAAIEWQLDELHPFGDAPIIHAAADVGEASDSGGKRRTAVAVTLSSRIEAYADRFRAAGVPLAGCTVSPSALRAVTHRDKMPATPAFLIADVEGPHVELYGQSSSNQPWSAALDADTASVGWALQSARDDLSAGDEGPMLMAFTGDGEAGALPHGQPSVPVAEILKRPASSPGDFDLARDAVAYGTAIEAARPSRGFGLPLLPPAKRSRQGLGPYAQTMTIAAGVVFLAGGLAVRPALQNASYARALQEKTAALEASTAVGSQRLANESAVKAKAAWLRERRERVAEDLSTIQEISASLPTSAWLTALVLDDETALLSGVAEDADPLLATLDGTDALSSSRFVKAPVSGRVGELFQIEARRR